MAYYHLVSCMAIGGSSILFLHQASLLAHAQGAPSPPPSKVGLHSQSYCSAIEKAGPSVVNVQCSAQANYSFITGISSGSGFIISESGRVVTNGHVVSGCERRPTVTLDDNRQFPATVVGIDEKTDVALLQIVIAKETSEGKFPVSTFGDSDKVKPGEIVLALGSPLMLQKTATQGIISAIQRQSGELGLSASHRTDFIQTDAPINIGNSGGPLVNLEGEVIAVTSMKAQDASGISFAIPINTVKAVVHQLALHGRVKRPYIGIFMLTLAPSIIENERSIDPNFPDIKEGILVTSVTPSGPAAKAGLRQGDVIYAVNDGVPTPTAEALMNYVGFDRTDPIIFHIRRGKRDFRASVVPILRD
uniref:PDZ domain-containing protein n=1 Tax=Spongospora subterranea TaxID=70186 RepID=A0A0H5R7C6_9EUKA|eukprot:CRZ09657.1 hypothetical protein [Spongospora subterranea]